MEDQPNTIRALFDNASEHLETRLDLLKLQAVSKTSEAVSSIVSVITILIFVLLGIFVLNIGLALWIGELLGKVYLGFFVVAAFYALVALILYLFRNAWLKEPLSTMIIKKMLN